VPTIIVQKWFVLPGRVPDKKAFETQLFFIMSFLLAGIVLAAVPEGQLVVTYFSDFNNCREGNIGNVTTLLTNQCIPEGSRSYRATCVNGNAVRYDCATTTCEQCTEALYSSTRKGQCERSGGGRAQPRGVIVDFTCPVVQQTTSTSGNSATSTESTSSVATTSSRVQATSTTDRSVHTTTTATYSAIATTNAAKLANTAFAAYLGTLISLFL
jgi:hypothetical protein